MELKIIRIKSNTNFTEGRLYINGVYFCDTLEDKDRGLDQSMSEFEIRKRKIYAETCIPSGEYRVILSHSPKFKRILPEVLNVKGFTGIRIHNGVDQNSTSGCLIVGKKWQDGKVTKSRETLNELLQILKQTKEDINLTIGYE